jgi:hypothetical protein
MLLHTDCVASCAFLHACAILVGIALICVARFAKPHTEVQGGAVPHGMPKSPAFVTFHLLLNALDVVNVLPLFAPLPQHGGIL